MRLRMYKGIDEKDGALSLFLVSTKGTACSFYLGEGDPWEDKETFLDLYGMDCDMVLFVDTYEYIDSVKNAELIWEIVE